MLRKMILVGTLAAICAGDAFPQEKDELDNLADYCPYMNYPELPFPPEDIDETILENAAKNQVVMFGEAHGCWVADNLYVTSLLPKLKELGYNHITAEILKSDQRLLDAYFAGDEEKGKKLEEKYNDVDGSFLSLFKTAYDLGFEVHCIDDPMESGRDKRMFKHMVNKIFNYDPDAKVVVFIGDYHIRENETLDSSPLKGEECKWLACYLNEFTENKTYTIDLTPSPDKVDLVAFPDGD